ncbi:probable ATP-dependent RNA helicase DDX31 [Pomacea canaliculata]|uniref:probable ATP-dependent RNA helicase DDX31 n=1 Tax=Pomacea canaliculata TaxID=400727 RepID=UPI000D739EFD|nr:probable ATP-dependent RNA helicase DDX31 [Pomacea canaliculata]
MHIQQKVHGEPISSLFKHNPEIPSVKSANVPGIKEEVFASTKFQDTSLHPHLISTLEQRLGLTVMTRVQQLTIPVILKNNDVLVKSQTGSGKTLAYAMPIINCLMNRAIKVGRDDGPYVLVVVPTRELAVQTLETFSTVLQSAVWIVAGCLMGGEKRKTEKARIRKGINILIGTPGRLLDHIQHTDCLSLSKVEWLVLDEADRLLDMGYEKDVAEIVTALNTKGNEHRQTILLSATLTTGVERLAGMALRNHEMIDASSMEHEGSKSKNVQDTVSIWPQSSADNQAFALPEKLKQYFVIVPCKLRLVTLAAFILWRCKMQSKKSKMVVFLSTQDSVEFHHRLFSQVLISGAKKSSHLTEDEDNVLPGTKDESETATLFKLHGEMSQKERTKVFQDFSAAQQGVLLCTDVASRGLHLPKVDWIVQYTTPGATVDYIHRVGRTARAGKQGNALLFLMPAEAEYIKELNNHKISLSEVPIKDVLLTLLTAVYELPLPPVLTKRQDPRTYEEAATYLQDRFEECVLRDPNMQTLAAKGYQSFVRAYATYTTSLKKMFAIKDLHLGHVAKSFALRQTPSHLSNLANRPLSKAFNPGFRFRAKADLAREGTTAGSCPFLLPCQSSAVA